MVERPGGQSRHSEEDLLVRGEGLVAGLEEQSIVIARGHLGNSEGG